MKQKKSYMKTNNTRFLLSSLVMCTSLCFWGCSNDENEFVISSER